MVCLAAHAPQAGSAGTHFLTLQGSHNLCWQSPVATIECMQAVHGAWSRTWYGFLHRVAPVSGWPGRTGHGMVGAGVELQHRHSAYCLECHSA